MSNWPFLRSGIPDSHILTLVTLALYAFITDMRKATSLVGDKQEHERD